MLVAVLQMIAQARIFLAQTADGVDDELHGNRFRQANIQITFERIRFGTKLCGSTVGQFYNLLGTLQESPALFRQRDAAALTAAVEQSSVQLGL